MVSDYPGFALLRMPRAPPYQTPSIAKHCLNLAHDSGKSAAGQKLSTALSYCFFDTDDMIVALSGKSIADIFREEGEEAFRTTETAVIQVRRQHCQGLRRCLGGGDRPWGVGELPPAHTSLCASVQFKHR